MIYITTGNRYKKKNEEGGESYDKDHNHYQVVIRLRSILMITKPPGEEVKKRGVESNIKKIQKMSAKTHKKYNFNSNR